MIFAGTIQQREASYGTKGRFDFAKQSNAYITEYDIPTFVSIRIKKITADKAPWRIDDIYKFFYQAQAL
jgi:hypothetical protein